MSISKDDVAVLLASALGQHKSEELVAATASGLGITRATLSAADVRGIFDSLVRTEGLVGVVARFAVSRGDVDTLLVRAEAAAPSSGSMPAAAATEATATQTGFDIVHLISPALGVEKAREAIEHAAARRGVDARSALSYDAALAVLDELTKVEGIVGVVARFAKARFLLDPQD
jgi:hypothetical protein